MANDDEDECRRSESLFNSAAKRKEAYIRRRCVPISLDPRESAATTCGNEKCLFVFRDTGK